MPTKLIEQLKLPEINQFEQQNGISVNEFLVERG